MLSKSVCTLGILFFAGQALAVVPPSTMVQEETEFAQVQMTEKHHRTRPLMERLEDDELRLNAVLRDLKADQQELHDIRQSKEITDGHSLH